MKGCAACASCEQTLDVWGNTRGEFPLAYSEDMIDGRTVFFCRECTLEAYAFCETVWVTYPPLQRE